MTKFDELTNNEVQDTQTTIVYVLGGERRKNRLSDYIKFGVGMYIGYVATKAIAKVLKEKLEQK